MQMHKQHVARGPVHVAHSMAAGQKESMNYLHADPSFNVVPNKQTNS